MIITQPLAKKIVGIILPDTEEVLKEYINLLLEEYRYRLENSNSWEDTRELQGSIKVLKRLSKIRETAINVLKDK